MQRTLVIKYMYTYVQHNRSEDQTKKLFLRIHQLDANIAFSHRMTKCLFAYISKRWLHVQESKIKWSWIREKQKKFLTSISRFWEKLQSSLLNGILRSSSILQGWIKRRNIILKRNIFDVTNEEEKHLGIFHIVTKLDRKETLPCSFGPVKRNTCNISLYVEIRASMSWLLDKKGEPKPGFCPAFSSRNYFAIVNFGPEIWWKFSGRPLIRNTARGAVKFILRYWK